MAPGALLTAALLLIGAVAGLALMADRSAAIEAGRSALGDPLGLALIATALTAAFSARALAWSRLLPGLGFGQALAAIHLALGANHVLPFRLGEPLRVLSAVHRGRVRFASAATTTVALRAADMVSLLLLGLLAGPRLVAPLLGWWGLVAALFIGGVGLGAIALRLRRSSSGSPERRPGPGPILLTTAAWALEAVVVWRVAGWFGIDLSPAEAMVVLAAAVSAQILAVTPAGVGTYEAAATTALVATGVPLDTAVAVAVVIHLVKTVYSLVAGALAVVHPRPGLLGGWRLDRIAPPVPLRAAGADGPVVLFLPARNEGPRVAGVVAAAPRTVGGHPVEVVVVDDGSTDDTAARARAAGADVVVNPAPHGLGAAVRAGLAEGVARGAVAVAFCDADGEYDPGQLARLVEPILGGEAHYVIGTRFGGNIEWMRPHRRLGNRLLTMWVRHIVGLPVTDGQSGFRALSGRAAATAGIAHDYNYAQVLTVDVVARGFGYHEVPITYHFRRSGRSFVRLGTYLANVVPTVWRLLDLHRSDTPVDHSRRENLPCELQPDAASLHSS